MRLKNYPLEVTLGLSPESTSWSHDRIVNAIIAALPGNNYQEVKVVAVEEVVHANPVIIERGIEAVGNITMLLNCTVDIVVPMSRIIMKKAIIDGTAYGVSPTDSSIRLNDKIGAEARTIVRVRKVMQSPLNPSTLVTKFPSANRGVTRAICFSDFGEYADTPMPRDSLVWQKLRSYMTAFINMANQELTAKSAKVMFVMDKANQQAKQLDYFKIDKGDPEDVEYIDSVLDSLLKYIRRDNVGIYYFRGKIYACKLGDEIDEVPQARHPLNIMSFMLSTAVSEYDFYMTVLGQLEDPSVNSREVLAAMRSYMQS